MRWRQQQAVERIQPGLPLRFYTPVIRTHDYKRHGTTSLFAAVDVATVKVIGQLKRRHRSANLLQCRKAVDAAVPAEMDIHLIVDNDGTHKTQKMREQSIQYDIDTCNADPMPVAWHKTADAVLAPVARVAAKLS